MAGSGTFFDQFIEDYFAECDEHLATTRRLLLALESAAHRLPDAQLLRELHRSLHTLKGLSGMVGDEHAERVAHALETALRAAGAAHAPVAPALVDALFAGADVLARCVGARRTGSAAPDVGAVVAMLTRDAAVAQPAPPQPVEGASNAPSDGGIVRRFEFTPSIALTQRGMGVDAIRTRLAALGTVLDAKPRIVAGGVAFDFWVDVPVGRAPDEAWRDDGLQWASVVDASPAAIETPMRAAPVTDMAQPSSVVRVDLGRLDGVMRLVGDLVISRSRLDDVLQQAAAAGRSDLLDALEEMNAMMERQLRRLRDSVMRIRLVPIGEVFERLRFAARDAIRESGKEVALSFKGQTTEIDKLVVDRILEPLLHLVRNAVSHGIERPDERLDAGKPREGRLTLRATASGDRILVEVEDDGAGIDAERVAARAKRLGVLEPDEQLLPAQLLDVLCMPGFSTREEADMTSGRGVGMDVVRSTVRALSGELSLETTPGNGTCFTIELPLTLMILDALLIEIADQQMAVPQPALREVLQIDAASIVRFENNDVVPYRGGVLPLVSLAKLFRIPERRLATRYVLVVGSAAAPTGLVVDRVVGLREIVVQPVTDPLVALPGIAGATQLGDGRVSLILDPAALLRLAHAQRGRRPVAGR